MIIVDIFFWYAIIAVVICIFSLISEFLHSDPSYSLLSIALMVLCSISWPIILCFIIWDTTYNVGSYLLSKMSKVK